MRPALLLTLALALLAPTSAAAQIAGPPFVFVNGPGNIIEADEVNANFAAIYAAALNRTGGTMSGPLLFSPDNTVDIGANGTTRPRDLWLGRNASVGGTLAVTGASTFTGAVTIGSGNIAETAITNGALLARVADAETISGRWNFTNLRGLEATSTTPQFWLSETGAPANSGKWQMNADAGILTFQVVNDAENATAAIFQIFRTGTTLGAMTFGPTQLEAAAGSAAAPVWSYVFDSDTGVYNPSANALGFTTGGTLRWTIDSGGALVPTNGSIGNNPNGVDRIFMDNGAVGTPSITFETDTDTGLYRTAGAVNVAIDGARVTEVVAGGFNAYGFIGSTAQAVIGTFVRVGTVAFASLPGAPEDGTIIYCSNCTIANPCAGAGSGALAKRINSVWVCN